MALALKEAHDDLRRSADEIDRLKDKVNFYEKTFPLTITRHNKQQQQHVPNLNLHSHSEEPTNYQQVTTPETLNTV